MKKMITPNTDIMVSICCLTYNHENYIAQAIEGFLMQKTNFRIEVIIHDDASQDNTDSIVNKYSEKFPDIIFPIFQSENQYSKGVRGIAARFAFPRARGKYIALCEGDDYWTDPLKLQKQVDFLEKNADFSICSHNVIVKYENNNSLDNEWLGSSQKEISTIEDLVRYGSGGATCSLLFRSSIIEQLPDWYYNQQSGDWTLQILCASTGKMRYFKEVMGVYRRHYGGMTDVKPNSRKELDVFLAGGVTLCEEINRHFEFKYDSLIRKNLADYFYWNLMNIYFRLGNAETAKAYAYKILSELFLSKEIHPDKLMFILNLFDITDEEGVKSFLIRTVESLNKLKVNRENFIWFLRELKKTEYLKKGLYIGSIASECPEIILRESKTEILYCYEAVSEEIKNLNELYSFTGLQLSAFNNRYIPVENLSSIDINDIDFIIITADNLSELQSQISGLLNSGKGSEIILWVITDNKNEISKFQSYIEVNFDSYATSTENGMLLLNVRGPVLISRETFGLNEAMKVSPVWTEAYRVTEKLIKKFNIKKGAEIGVARGHHSAHLLELFPELQLFSIDPWKHYNKDYNDPANVSQDKFDLIYKNAKNLVEQFGARAKVIRASSQEAGVSFNEELDFVFIDANHTYDSVKEDITIWWDKVKPGGIVAGHDYGHPDFEGVKCAVDEVLAEKGYTPNVEDGTVWWVRKNFNHFLSFIIPCYNCADTVPDAIESIYHQNLNIPFEVICTDDCSTDNTLNVLKKYRDKHVNFIIESHSANKGGGAARNTCVKNSSGDLIFCLDSDNILEKNSIQPLIDYFGKSGCEAVSFSEIKYFTNQKKEITHSWILACENNIYNLNHIISDIQTPASSGNYLYTKSSYLKAGGYPESAGAMDAWGFGFRQLATGTKIAVLPGSCYWHRTSPNSYWTREEAKKNNDRNGVYILRDFLNLFNEETQKWLLSPASESELFKNIRVRKTSNYGFVTTE